MDREFSDSGVVPVEDEVSYFFASHVTTVRAVMTLHMVQDDLVADRCIGLFIPLDAVLQVFFAAYRRVLRGEPVGQVKGLSYPHHVASCCDGDMLAITDTYEHRIVLASVATGQIARKFGKRGKDDSSFMYPYGIISIPSLPKHCSGCVASECIVVCDRNNHRVKVHNVQTTKMVAAVTNEAVLKEPFCVCAHPDWKTYAGCVFVSCGSTHCIALVNLVQRCVVASFGSGGTAPGQFGAPWGVAVLSTDVCNGQCIVAVADTLRERVQVFDCLALLRDNWGRDPTLDSNSDVVANRVENYAPLYVYNMGKSVFSVSAYGRLILVGLGDEVVLMRFDDGVVVANVSALVKERSGTTLRKAVGCCFTRDGSLAVVEEQGNCVTILE